MKDRRFLVINLNFKASQAQITNINPNYLFLSGSTEVNT